MAGLGAAPATAETLRFATNWEKTLFTVVPTIKWAEEFNESEAAKAVDLRIEYIGGPEISPARQQLEALKNGLFDMMQGAGGYYVGMVPESLGVQGATVTPMEARENGGIDLMNEIYLERAGVRVLGWVAAGVGFNIWLKDAPKFDAQGFPDLGGRKIRSSGGSYQPWLESMNATQVTIAVPEMYTALERGVADGMAYPALGIMELGLEKILKYRVDPPVWQFDNWLWISDAAWGRLNEEQRKVLTDAVIAFEEVAYNHLASEVVKEREALAAAGLESVSVNPEVAEKYLANAGEIHWREVQQRAPEKYEEMRAHFLKSE